MAQSKSASVDTVQQARTKARQRLIGAVVLLLVGIIGFPLVFETQPRPIPVDVAIEIPRKDTAPPLQAPGQRAAPAASGSVPPVSANAARGVETAPAASAAQPAPPAPAAAAVPTTATPAASTPALPAARPKPAAEPSSPPVASAPNAPAAAVAGVEEPGRFVVQVGAFADAAAVQTIRSRAEKLGLKTYTQVAETVSGNRTRVRIGPFATREAAERAAAKAKAGGLSAVVLTL
jgi:DedD protein